MRKNIELVKHENQDLKKLIFSPKSNPKVIGREKEKQLLVSFVRNGDICFLTGPPGTGKTSLLLWLAKNLKSHNIFYIDAASIEKGFSIKEFLKKSRKGFDKLRAFPKESVILLDESQDCDFELQKALKLHWDHNHIKSIVVTQIDKKLKNFSVSFRDRIGNRVIKLGKLSKPEAVELIKSRCGNKNIFDLKTTEEIARKADYKPRKILETCELYCLQNNFIKTKKKSSKKKVKAKNLIKKNPAPRKIPSNSQVCTYGVNGESKKILTMMQKKIISEIKKGNTTVDDLAKNLGMPTKEVENELMMLFKNGIVNVTGKNLRSQEA